MPRGAPDHSNVRSADPLHRLDDHAELAARMESIVTYDRGGNVIYIETFERGMPQWGTAGYGTGSAAGLSSLRAAKAPFSLALTTGGDGAHGVKAMLQVPYHHDCKMGLEYAFTHTANSLYHYFDFLYRNGTTRFVYGVRFDIQNGELQVRNELGTWTTFATGLTLDSDAWLFNQGKLVVDIVNEEYERFTFNDTTWKLDSYEPPQYAETSVPYIECSIQFIGDIGSNRTHYIDNVIITQNEPSNP